MDEVKDALIGVDPDDTMEVLFKGASFTIGVIPAGIWESLVTRHLIAIQEARQRALKRLLASGVDPKAVREKGGKEGDPTELDYATSADPQFRSDSANLAAEGARYAVREHKRFLKRDKNPVPQDFEEVMLDGVNVRRMAESTFRYYKVNVDLCSTIWPQLFTLNQLGGEAKKV